MCFFSIGLVSSPTTTTTTSPGSTSASICRIVSSHLELIIYSSGQLAVGPIELMGAVTGRQGGRTGDGGDRLQSSDIVCHLGLLN